MVWKITIILWVVYFIDKALVKASLTSEEKAWMVLTGHAKMTPKMWFLLFLLAASVTMSVITLVWFLFIKL